MIVEPYKGLFYKLRVVPSSVLNWVRYDVPPEYRYMEIKGNIGYWYIHEKYLLNLIRLVYKKAPEAKLEYSALPDHLILQIEQAIKKWGPRSDKAAVTYSYTENKREDFSILYLLPSAPKAIVDAVWKQIIKMHHPDKGGDADEFQRYKSAYYRLRED